MILEITGSSPDHGQTNHPTDDQRTRQRADHTQTYNGQRSPRALWQECVKKHRSLQRLNCPAYTEEQVRAFSVGALFVYYYCYDEYGHPLHPEKWDNPYASCEKAPLFIDCWEKGYFVLLTPFTNGINRTTGVQEERAWVHIQNGPRRRWSLDSFTRGLMRRIA
jgi:hypothetical protein